MVFVVSDLLTAPESLAFSCYKASQVLLRFCRRLPCSIQIQTSTRPGMLDRSPVGLRYDRLPHQKKNASTTWRLGRSCTERRVSWNSPQLDPDSDLDNVDDVSGLSRGDGCGPSVVGAQASLYGTLLL